MISAGFTATNAASSGIRLERKLLKALAKRSDKPGLVFLGLWALSLVATGYLVYLALGTVWVYPAMFVYGTILTLSAYAMSHETAHGTAFRTRWLNTTVEWLTALIYMEEPLHRRYTHTNHHSYTWHVGKDSQMPFDTPMTVTGWLVEVSGLALLYFHLRTLMRLVTGRYTDVMRAVIPAHELPKIQRNAWIFLLVYLAIGTLIVSGQHWLLWFLVYPRLLGMPILSLFGLIQHVEMQENSASIIDSTRSFKTDRLAAFLYLNMHNHIEHHLYPQVPFYSLPALHQAIKDQLPQPDPGFWRTNLEVLSVVMRRSMGRNTRARSIRQSPQMITDGRYQKRSVRSMR